MTSYYNPAKGFTQSNNIADSASSENILDNITETSRENSNANDSQASRKMYHNPFREEIKQGKSTKEASYQPDAFLKPANPSYGISSSTVTTGVTISTTNVPQRDPLSESPFINNKQYAEVGISSANPIFLAPINVNNGETEGNGQQGNTEPRRTAGFANADYIPEAGQSMLLNDLSVCDGTINESVHRPMFVNPLGLNRSYVENKSFNRSPGHTQRSIFENSAHLVPYVELGQIQRVHEDRRYFDMEQNPKANKQNSQPGTAELKANVSALTDDTKDLSHLSMNNFKNAFYQRDNSQYLNMTKMDSAGVKNSFYSPKSIEHTTESGKKALSSSIDSRKDSLASSLARKNNFPEYKKENTHLAHQEGDLLSQVNAVSTAKSPQLAEPSNYFYPKTLGEPEPQTNSQPGSSLFRQSQLESQVPKLSQSEMRSTDAKEIETLLKGLGSLDLSDISAITENFLDDDDTPNTRKTMTPKNDTQQRASRGLKKGSLDNIPEENNEATAKKQAEGKFTEKNYQQQQYLSEVAKPAESFQTNQYNDFTRGYNNEPALNSQNPLSNQFFGLTGTFPQNQEITPKIEEASSNTYSINNLSNRHILQGVGETQLAYNQRSQNSLFKSNTEFSVTNAYPMDLVTNINLAQTTNAVNQLKRSLPLYPQLQRQNSDGTPNFANSIPANPQDFGSPQGLAQAVVQPDLGLPSFNRLNSGSTYDLIPVNTLSADYQVKSSLPHQTTGQSVTNSVPISLPAPAISVSLKASIVENSRPFEMPVTINQPKEDITPKLESNIQGSRLASSSTSTNYSLPITNSYKGYLETGSSTSQQPMTSVEPFPKQPNSYFDLTLGVNKQPNINLPVSSVISSGLTNLEAYPRDPIVKLDYTQQSYIAPQPNIISNLKQSDQVHTNTTEQFKSVDSMSNIAYNSAALRPNLMKSIQSQLGQSSVASWEHGSKVDTNSNTNPSTQIYSSIYPNTIQNINLNDNFASQFPINLNTVQYTNQTISLPTNPNYATTYNLTSVTTNPQTFSTQSVLGSYNVSGQDTIQAFPSNLIQSNSVQRETVKASPIINNEQQESKFYNSSSLNAPAKEIYSGNISSPAKEAFQAYSTAQFGSNRQDNTESHLFQQNGIRSLSPSPQHNSIASPQKPVQPQNLIRLPSNEYTPQKSQINHQEGYTNLFGSKPVTPVKLNTSPSSNVFAAENPVFSRITEQGQNTGVLLNQRAEPMTVTQSSPQSRLQEESQHITSKVDNLYNNIRTKSDELTQYLDEIKQERSRLPSSNTFTNPSLLTLRTENAPAYPSNNISPDQKWRNTAQVPSLYTKVGEKDQFSSPFNFRYSAQSPSTYRTLEGGLPQAEYQREIKQSFLEDLEQPDLKKALEVSNQFKLFSNPIFKKPQEGIFQRDESRKSAIAGRDYQRDSLQIINKLFTPRSQEIDSNQEIGSKQEIRSRQEIPPKNPVYFEKPANVGPQQHPRQLNTPNLMNLQSSKLTVQEMVRPDQRLEKNMQSKLLTHSPEENNKRSDQNAYSPGTNKSPQHLNQSSDIGLDDTFLTLREEGQIQQLAPVQTYKANSELFQRKVLGFDVKKDKLIKGVDERKITTNNMEIICINCQEFVNVNLVDKHSKSCHKMSLYNDDDNPDITMRFSLDDINEKLKLTQEKIKTTLQRLQSNRPLINRVQGILESLSQIVDEDSNLEDLDIAIKEAELIMDDFSDSKLSGGQVVLLMYINRAIIIAKEKYSEIQFQNLDGSEIMALEDRLREYDVETQKQKAELEIWKYQAQMLNDIRLNDEKNLKYVRPQYRKDNEVLSHIQSDVDYSDRESSYGGTSVASGFYPLQTESSLARRSPADNVKSESKKIKFYSTAVNAKLSLPANHAGKDVLISDLYEECLRQNIPEEHWEKFIKAEIEAN